MLAIIRAMRGTSAPIRERLGFEIVCPFDPCVWRPAGGAN